MSLIDTAGRSGSFLTPGAEPGHHHRVGAQVVEEVAVDRHPLDVHHLSQYVGEDPLAQLGAATSTTGASPASAVARLLIVRCW